jgi:hypothetical protein
MGSKSQGKSKHRDADESVDDDEDEVYNIDTSIFEEDDDTGKLERLRSSSIGSKGLLSNVMKSGIQNSSNRNRPSQAVEMDQKDKVFPVKSKKIYGISKIGKSETIDEEKRSSSSDSTETSEPSLGRRRPSRLAKVLQRKKQQREAEGKQNDD